MHKQQQTHHETGFDFEPFKQDITTICEESNVKSLMSFGSANLERFCRESDIDILVKFGSCERGTLFDRYFSLKERLENLFDRQVEILFDKKFKNPYFMESVNKTRKMIYEA